MRLIDADELNIYDVSPVYGFVVMGMTEEDINDAPTVDAVEVVRCKDCAKREYCRTTNVWATVPDDDWFCADAERRSE